MVWMESMMIWSSWIKRAAYMLPSTGMQCLWIARLIAQSSKPENAQGYLLEYS